MSFKKTKLVLLAFIFPVILMFGLSACALQNSYYKHSDLTHAERKVIASDIWLLEAIEGQKIVLTSDTERPRLEIQLADMRIMGTDGCNGYFASIDFIDEQKIQFGPIASTRKYCAEMAIPDHFNQQMNQVKIYQVENLKLRLFDGSGNELLLFQKSD